MNRRGAAWRPSQRRRRDPPQRHRVGAGEGPERAEGVRRAGEGGVAIEHAPRGSGRGRAAREPRLEMRSSDLELALATVNLRVKPADEMAVVGELQAPG